jgi:uncharacterized protein (TIGR00730 family)
MDSSPKLVVFGSSRCPEGSTDQRQAYELGSVVASRGLILVSGGYDGSMGAASKGAKEAGGKVLGITTAIFEDRQANPWLDERIDEPDYPARMAHMMRLGDAFVALPGALGTLSEWLVAWCLASIDQLGGPLWAFDEPWRKIHDQVLELPEVSADKRECVRWLQKPSDLAGELDAWLSRR